MKLLSFFLLALLLLATAGCVGAGYYPTMPTASGILINETTSPVRPELQMQNRQSIIPTKGGRACSYSAFGLFAWGDNSFGRAIREGNIRTVSSVDTSQSGIPLLGTGSICTVVEGN